MLTRKSFIKLIAAGSASTYMATRAHFLQLARAQASPQIPINPASIPQFIDLVPNLLDANHLIVDYGSRIDLEMREHKTNVLPTGAVPNYTGTYVWSYLKPGQDTRPSYLGPVILATRHQPTEMKFTNLLGNSLSTNVLAYKYSTDQTLHWADPLHDGESMWNHMVMPPAYGSEGAANYDGPIPAVPHLHGGYVPPVLDGGPDAWFTSDGSHVGSGFYSKDWDGQPQNYCTYRYPNSQEGALIWFHDHTLGATRLNVFAGLAGAYLITDPAHDPANLPELFPLVIQDRTFDTNGQFILPAATIGGVLWSLNPEHPYWVPEFVGDTILVNGKTWPYMNVTPKRYTFMLINGSNARAYEMSLVDPVSKNFGPPLWVIGTDGGYLDMPVKIDPSIKGNNKLVILPGERYWIIVDFKGYEAGVMGPNKSRYSGKWLLKNTAKVPYPGGITPDGATSGRIMQFVVTGGPVNDTSYNPATGASVRPTPMVRLTSTPVQHTRQLTLNEVMGMPQNAIDPVTGAMTAFPGGPLEILVNNTKWTGERIKGIDPMNTEMYEFESRSDFTLDYLGKNWLSERPIEGETEVWEIVNLTADAHPIHLHLVQFQLINRQNFDVSKYLAAYGAAFPGGGYDPMTKTAYPAGVYIPGFGPPLHYTTGNPRALGGNPDIIPFLKSVPIPALPQENGWKDTVAAYPGQVTRFIVRWAPTEVPSDTQPANANFPFDPAALGGGYVWHCHIVDHEDNEMMRPDEIQANPDATRTYVQGVDY